MYGENFCGFCFICIESATIYQRITIPIYQKYMKIAKLFSHEAFVVYGIMQVNGYVIIISYIITI